MEQNISIENANADNLKRLNHYDVFEVIDTFNIEKNLGCKVLNDWMTVEGILSTTENELVTQAREKLELKWDEWNEEELKMHFISLIFFVAKIEIPKLISTFYERRFVGKVDEINISLVVDCMVASTTNSGLPKSPYFFLQTAPSKPSLEGKEKNDNNPEGQMLAAMILAQEKNKDDKPLYGSWIQGRFWYFTVLTGNDYCVSKPFDATDNDALLKIVFILRKLKDLILNR